MPGGAVDFGEIPGAAGTRGPFHLEGVAADGGGVEIDLDGGCVDDLAAFLLTGLSGRNSPSTGEPSSSSNSRMAFSSGSSPGRNSPF